MTTKTIMFIDGDSHDVSSFERALAKINLPHAYYTAQSIDESLKILTEKKIIPHIIIIDPILPGQDGIEFLEELRKNSIYDHTKIFVMTTTNESRKRVEPLGISGYILKPMNFTDNTKRSAYMDYFMHFQIIKILVRENDV